MFFNHGSIFFLTYYAHMLIIRLERKNGKTKMSKIHC